MSKIYDLKKFILIAVVFAGALSFPFWGSLIAKEELRVPDTSKAGEACVEDRAFMRKGHMALLHQWRDEVVRENKRIYTNSHRNEFNKSQSKTCLGCHQSNEQFCESCHQSAGVKTYCFDCHDSGVKLPAGAPKENPHE